MNADKRNVHTDALETLGTIIGDGEARDAIHLAVEPVVAGHDLTPGDHITLKDGKAIKAMPGSGLGIVDPFIDGVVSKGERFWLVVYPRKITSLRHVWSHPDFPKAEVEAVPQADSKSASYEWLAKFGDQCGAGFFEMMQRVEEYLKYEDDSDRIYASFDIYGDIPPEFWTHFENVTGLAPEGEKPTHFSCSC